MGQTHLVATCGNCGAPQPLTLSAPIGACAHCGHDEPIKPALRERLNDLRSRLARRDRAPMQLTSKVLVEGDHARSVGYIALVVSWLLGGGFALYLSLSHDVGLVDFVVGGEPAQQWWLLWSLAFGLAFSVGLLELGVARIRGLSAQALPVPPVSEGAPPRCRCCAAELGQGTALRRCGSCDADNLVVGSRYMRVEEDLDRALDDLEAQFEGDLKKRISTAGTISMAGALSPFALLFIGPVAGLFTPGWPELWLIPGGTAVLAVGIGWLAKRRRLPVEAVELLSIGDKVHFGEPINGKRGVCAQLMLDSGPVSLLGKNTAEAELGVSAARHDGELQVAVYRIEPGQAAPGDRALVSSDLWERRKKGAPEVRQVHALVTGDGWRMFDGPSRAPHLDATRMPEAPVVVVV